MAGVFIISTQSKNYGKRLLRPKTWSVKARRAFVLTLPISVPVWLLAMVGIGIGKATQELFTPLANFWSAPPEKLRNYGNYSYSRPRSNKVVPLDEARERRDEQITGT